MILLLYEFIVILFDLALYVRDFIGKIVYLFLKRCICFDCLFNLLLGRFTKVLDIVGDLVNSILIFFE